MADVPIGVLLNDPVIVCRDPQDAKNISGKAKYQPASACADPPAFKRKDGRENVHLKARLATVVVVWESCQIDKFAELERPEAEWFAAVAPVIPLARVNSEEARRAIVEFRKFAAFPLPAGPDFGVPEESFIDLRFVQPVAQSILKKQRVGALAPDAVAALHAHYVWFLTRRRIVDDPTCPKCGTDLPVDAIAPKTGTAGD